MSWIEFVFGVALADIIAEFFFAILFLVLFGIFALVAWIYSKITS